MKRILVATMFIGLFAGPALAQGSHYVEGYTRSNGTYVAPHYQTNPNETRNDNWSTEGNVNPYTGQIGTRAPDMIRPYSPPPARYESPRGQSSYGHGNFDPATGQYVNHDPSSSYGSPNPY